MNSLKLSKFCNKLFSGDADVEDEYVDLSNYVFRMSYLMEKCDVKATELEGLTKKDAEEAEKHLKEFFKEVKRNCRMDEYLVNKKREFRDKMSEIKGTESNNNLKADDGDIIECIEIEDSEVMVPKIKSVEAVESMEVSEESALNEELIEKSKAHMDLFVKLFDKNSDKELEESFAELMNDKNLEYIKQVCQLLANKIAESEKHESKLGMLANFLTKLSSSSSTVTYTKLVIVLKHLFSNYLILVNRNKATKQVDTFTLTKQMLAMCSSLFKSFPNQFTEACFIEWLKLLIMDSNAKNCKNSEFLLKIYKDLFNESEAVLVLNFILAQHGNKAWNEDIYAFLNNIFDKVQKPTQSDLILLVNKMKADCQLFSKSLPFAKFLSNVITRLKNLGNTNGDQALPSEGDIQDKYIEPVRQEILYIIDKNQTLMKKKLSTML